MMGIVVIVIMAGVITFYKIRYELARSNLVKCELEREIEQSAILNLHAKLESAKTKLPDKSKEIDSRYMVIDIDNHERLENIGSAEGIDNLSRLTSAASCNNELGIIDEAMRVFYAR